jgi:hypothetical protein
MPTLSDGKGFHYLSVAVFAPASLDRDKRKRRVSSIESFRIGHNL